MSAQQPGAAAVSSESQQLHRKLSSFGVLLLTLSCLSPVLSIYGVGIGVALVWAIIYAELGSAFPDTGDRCCFRSHRCSV